MICCDLLKIVMGNSQAVAPGISDFDSVDNSSYVMSSYMDDSSSVWKALHTVDEARKMYVEDHTLSEQCDRDYVELRTLLMEPVAQPIIGNYAKRHRGLEYLLCWVDMQEYKSLSSDMRFRKANYIYQKYIEEGADLSIRLGV